MIETASQHDTKQLGRKITALHHYFLENGDEDTAEKAKQLFLKLHNHEYGVAFCGHFSAGKSSMINRIMEENLLPSSPIPTSANLVKIKTGEEYAKVFFKEGKPRLYPAPYNFEKVKSYCKDGDSIQSIEISHLSDKLPKDACIMDTPGIDSTDDAHRVATESALHLADLIFYVMDYNHVQSELNFLFTKELTEAGKDVYLVINQIDKHQDEELSFEQFKDSVRESFAAWGVNPAEIFYTSLKDQKHAQNQFERLQIFIQSKLEQRQSLLPETVKASLEKLTEEHYLFLKEKDGEKLASLEEVLKDVPIKEQPELITRLSKVEEKIQELTSSLDAKRKEFDNEVEAILKNAYLMPFETRALAESYLHSTQSDFKVGLFFAKQKTEQERASRLEKLFADFKEKVNSQITWHMKEFLNRLFLQQEINNQELLQEVQSLSVEVTKDLLNSALKKGAHVTGDYVLNYTGDVAELAKKATRRAVANIKAAYLKALEEKIAESMLSLKKEKSILSELCEGYEKKQEILTEQTAILIRMEQIFNEDNEEAFEKFPELQVEDENVEIAKEEELEFEEQVSSNTFDEEDESSIKPLATEDEQLKINAVVKKLDYSATKLKSLPGFAKLSTLLLEKAERLKNQSFTVALFGAFSAGKSSFANSLIGEKLLPVSPNPTTAAINKIMPVDKENKHGLVKVYLKPSEVLFEDVNQSLAVFDLKADDFEQALALSKKVVENTMDFDAYEKTHFSFLNAFSKGYNAYADQLGRTLHTDIYSFKDFVANEEKSCLVDLIEVHFDCELTRKGITLVDTPGADSINARHTGVAFDYIKNSDAILFVTYYNHAFSKADREFLIQLGRVKDTFEMDKMFFIVNAVDLANNEEEKGEVLSYVRDQLIQYGIRKPNLFPVSSLLAIKEKQENQELKKSGLDRFEGKFYSFITHDLTDMTVTSALVEWERALEQLRSYIHSANEDNEQKQEKLKAFQLEQEQVEAIINRQQPSILSDRLNQEIEELTYYIKQRVFYRFNDFFKEAFNPAVLKDDGRNLKVALQHALDDFLEDFGFDFAQEFRATTLRVEKHLKRLLVENHEEIEKMLRKCNAELTYSPYQIKKMEGLNFDNVLRQLDRGLFKHALSLFKNPKAFFEKNEKRLMQDALYEALQEPSEQYLTKERDRLVIFYQNALELAFSILLEKLLGESKEYYEGMYATLSNEIPVEKLIELEKELKFYE